MGTVTAAAELGVAWVIMCVLLAGGLFLGERLLIMMRLHCDWADAGSRQRVLARKHYARHRRPVASVRKPRETVMVRADRVLAAGDPTHVITAVPDETVITGVPDVVRSGETFITETIVRPVATDVRPCCGTREGTGHLASCDPADRECPSHPGRYGDH